MGEGVDWPFEIPIRRRYPEGDLRRHGFCAHLSHPGVAVGIEPRTPEGDRPMVLNEKDSDELYRLEEGLWRAETRFDETWMRDTLARDFSEVGRSGRTYNLEQVLAAPAQEIPARLPLAHFAIRLLAPDFALVTYDSDVDYPAGRQLAHRTSVWSRTDGKWRCRFHQGTPFSVPG